MRAGQADSVSRQCQGDTSVRRAVRLAVPGRGGLGIVFANTSRGNPEVQTRGAFRMEGVVFTICLRLPRFAPRREACLGGFHALGINR